MFEEQTIHNQFRESVSRFEDHDPHLRRLKASPFVFMSPMLEEPNFHQPGIYLVTGGRQVGKTTFLKQFILHLLKQNKVNSDHVLFVTGEIINDHHALREMISRFIDEDGAHRYLFVDEVNYVKDWDKSMKFLADTGAFENVSVILTGSDSNIIRTSMQRLAGRRGQADETDFIFHPLSFYDFVCLVRKDLESACCEIMKTPLSFKSEMFEQHAEALHGLFRDYMLHGGYLPAIRDYHSQGDIQKATTNTYIQWIVGDMLRHNKSENYLFEILRGVRNSRGSLVSWNRLSRHLSIDHPATVSEYCRILEEIHVLHIHEAIVEHRLTAAPKKDRKIFFRDPFIDHAVSMHLEPKLGVDEIRGLLTDPERASSYVEAICVDHCKRHFPTFYIKGKHGEVDLALAIQGAMIPIEVKWTTQVRPADLKQVSRYANGIVVARGNTVGRVGPNIVVPLLRFLLQVSRDSLLAYIKDPG